MEKTTLKEVIKSLEKKYGEGAVLKCTDNSRKKIDVISTRSVSLDHATGIGGIPVGRIIEIYGPESSGKTTLSLTIVSEAQKKGIQCAYIDAEHALDLEYSKNLGVDIKKMYLSQPSSGEEALDIVENLVLSGEIGLIVIDSVAALTPQAEIDGEMGKMHIGLQARLMSQALRKLTAISAKSKTTIIFINQIRMKIGIAYGNPEVTSGGTALKFYCSMRIEIRRSTKLSKDDVIIGNRTNVKIVKNKLAAPFRTTEFDIYYNKGISIESDVINTGLNEEILTKDGNSIFFKDIRLGKSLESSREYLEKNKEILEKILTEIKQKYDNIKQNSEAVK
jgi:recombination protein RecA